MDMRNLLLVLLLFSAVYSIEVIDYYGAGCPHCARTAEILGGLTQEYNLSLTEKEIYSNEQNRVEMFAVYSQFAQDQSTAGVPTILVENKTLIIGEMSEQQWRELFGNYSSGTPLEGVFTAKTIDSGVSQGGTGSEDALKSLTIWGLVAAAVVDSINPCTIAIMVMLLSMILISDGRRKMLLSGLVFIGVIFICYLSMGFGIMKVVDNPALTNIFYTLTTLALLVIAALEIRAYFEYAPGFLAIEMPNFLRPHAKTVIEKATSLPGVAVAALFCSLFLLPCSSGPYLAVLAILAKSATAQVLGYLVLYNIIFVLPMVIITLGIYFEQTTLEKVGEAKEKYIRQIHLLSGIILFLLFIYMAHAMLNLF